MPGAMSFRPENASQLRQAILRAHRYRYDTVEILQRAANQPPWRGRGPLAPAGDRLSWFVHDRLRAERAPTAETGDHRRRF